MKFISLLVFSLVVFLFGCGTQSDCNSQSPKDANGKTQCKSDLASAESGKSSARSISGSLTGAFEVIVDGEYYRDIEDYYTHEVDALPARLEKLGYLDYDAKLDARLGYKDLTSGMIVYLAPVSRGGLADKAYVGANDQFTFILPAFAEDSSYRLKAVKRVNLILKNQTETLKFCFNFASVDKNVDLIEGKAEPVLLNEFQTSLTKYDCQQSEKRDGIAPPAIPSVEPSPTPSASPSPTPAAKE